MTTEYGWPGAGPEQNRVNPHQCSRSISAHWVSHHPSLCEKDSARLMGDRQGVKLQISQAGACFSCYFVKLFTICSSSTGFHCWLMVRSCEEMTELKKKSLVRALQCYNIKWHAEWKSVCCSLPVQISLLWCHQNRLVLIW